MTTAAANRYSGTGCCWKERKESKAFWADVFQDMDGWMVSRGLKKVQVFFFVVTDDFPGVREIIAKLYPFSDHQLLCFVHMQRNLMRRLSRKKDIRGSQTAAHLHGNKGEPDHGRRVEALCRRLCHHSRRGEDKQYAARLEERAGNYLVFLRYPEGVRKQTHLHTTNAVESINSGLEYMRRELGGYFPFPSRQALDVNNYFVQIRLQTRTSRG